MRIRRDVRLSTDPVPSHIVSPEPRARQGGMALAEGDHLLEEAAYIGVRWQATPVEPSDRAVHVIGVAVAALRLQELVAGAKHRRAVGQHQQAAEILNLPLPQFYNLRADTRLPVPIPAVPAIRRVVGDQVVEGQPVMRTDVVQALVGAVSIP